MCGSTPSAPPPPPPPEPPKEPARAVSDDVIRAREDEKKASRQARGRSSTIFTDSSLASNDNEPNTAKRAILG